MVLKLYMMYILYLNHGKELKANALPFGQAEHILEYHVNLQFNKIPQLAIHCNVKEMGA